MVLDSVLDRLEVAWEVLDHRRFQLNILDSYIGHHPLTSRRKAERNRPGKIEYELAPAEGIIENTWK